MGSTCRSVKGENRNLPGVRAGRRGPQTRRCQKAVRAPFKCCCESRRITFVCAMTATSRLDPPMRSTRPNLTPSTVADVATCGYTRHIETGIRELKDNLSRYIRRVESGQRIAVTAHGGAFDAELVPPGTATRNE